MRIILSILLLSVCYPLNQINTEYLIITPGYLASAAQALADMHTDSVEVAFRLNTEVVIVEDIATDPTNYDIREYIITKILDNSDLKFLLLFGDEIDIPPIYSNSNYPSDDFYTTADDDNIQSGDPQLASGRIPVSTEEDAWTIVNKIKKYTLHPTSGIWRSKVALVADDMYRSCSFDNGESSHTINSNNIYNALHALLPVLPFYGVDYGLQDCEHPDLTADLIRTINNGVALINYIGHGDIATWAGEKIITKSRDLPLIHVDDGKLAIWVAGTSSFGNYHGDENSFMEALLVKEDGAIAVVASTGEVGYTENSHYLNNLFGLNNILGIQHIVSNGHNIRLGELVLNSKNGSYHKFHTFGDPALPLPFPKIAADIVNEYPENINLVEEENISFIAPSQFSSILIRKNEKEVTYYHEDDSITTYTVPSVPYVQMDFTGSSTCFRIPMDAGSCNDCVVIQAYQENTGWDGKIETIKNISLLGSADDFDDIEGPVIHLYQKNRSLSDGSAIFPNKDITIALEDESGFNLLETIGHGIRYAYDDDNLTLLQGSEFIYEGCDSGFISIPVPPTLSEGLHRFYLEAWDGVNNKSTVDIQVCIDEIADDYDCEENGMSNEVSIIPTNYSISSIYPNPFNPATTISFSIPEFGLTTITAYDINGRQLETLTNEVLSVGNYSINWNASDYPSGVYLIRMESGDFTQTQKVVLVK